MTAARCRRATLAPLAAALAIACLALAAWSAVARADDVPLGSGDPATTGTSTDQGQTVAPGGQTGDPGGSTPDTSPVVEAPDPAPQPDPPAGDQVPSQPDPPAEGEPHQQPMVINDTPDTPTTDQWSDGSISGSTGHSSDSGSSSGSGPTTAVQTGTDSQQGILLPGETIDPLAPLTQFTLAPVSGSSSGGFGGSAALLAGGAHFGCIALCPGGSRLVGAFRLALSHQARSAVREARDRADGTAAKVSAPSLLGFGGGAVGLFNLLIGGGGNASTIVFVGFLAVLMALLALPRDWTTSFRLPSAVWRPSAYVTPIELPG